jgi:hypothetical protein
MPAGMAAMFVATLVLAVIYAMLYQGGSGFAEGARFGTLIGVFAVCAFVVHNCKPEHRAETDTRTSSSLLCRVDGRRHSDRPHLQARAAGRTLNWAKKVLAESSGARTRRANDKEAI